MASVIFILIVIGIFLAFRDYTGYYYNRVSSSDKIKIRDIDSGEDFIYVIDDNRKNIIPSFSLFPKNKANFKIEDTQIYKVEFLKKDKILLNILVGRVQTYEGGDNLDFQPTTSDQKNTLLYEHEGKEYISYTKRYYISWPENFYETIFDITYGL